MPTVKKEKVAYVPKGKTLAELAKELKPFLAKKSKLEAQLEEVKAAIHTLTVKVIPPIMETMDTDGQNIPGCGYIELGIEVYPYVKVEDQPKFYDWLASRGDRSIVKETIHPKTLQSFVKEGLEAGVVFPDYLTVGLVPTAKLKKEKTKGK